MERPKNHDSFSLLNGQLGSIARCQTLPYNTLILDGLDIENLRALLVWGPLRIHDMKIHETSRIP